jgi:hypothetical protein
VRNAKGGYLVDTILNRKVGAIPVVEAHRSEPMYVGIVHARDVLDALVFEHAGAESRSPRTTAPYRVA